MRHSHFRNVCLFAALLGTAVAASLHLPRYTLVDLGTLGGSFTSGNAVNALGQAIGASRTPGDAAVHAFLYSDGLMTDLGTFGGSYSYAFAINGIGLVTGMAATPGDAASDAFLYSGGKTADLGTLGGSSSGGTAINVFDK